MRDQKNSEAKYVFRERPEKTDRVGETELKVENETKEKIVLVVKSLQKLQ